MNAGPLLSIPRPLYERILVHCREEWPREAVGFLTGRGGVVLRATAVRNVHPDPERRFRVDPGDAALALRAVMAGREEWVGLYHSHPHSVAYPSPSDLLACDGPRGPGPSGPAFLLLVSLISLPPDVRAYRPVPGGPPVPVPHRKLDTPQGEWVDLR